MKRQKRRHTWKVKHVRRHHSLHGRGGSSFFTPDKWYVNCFNRSQRRIEKNSCIKIQRGYDEIELYFPRRHRHIASWMWN